MIRVALSGATGSVGRALVPAVEAAADLELAAQAAPSLGVSLDRGARSAAPTSRSTSPSRTPRRGRLRDRHLGRRAARPGDDAASRPPTSPATAITPPGTACQLFHAANFAIGAILMMRFAEEARAGSWTALRDHRAPRRHEARRARRARRSRPPPASAATPPIHSVRLPGPRRPPGGHLRRDRPDAHAPPRHDLARGVRPGRAARGPPHPEPPAGSDRRPRGAPVSQPGAGRRPRLGPGAGPRADRRHARPVGRAARADARPARSRRSPRPARWPPR